MTGELDYHYDSQGNEEAMTKHGSTFKYKRMVSIYSDDMGQTWSKGVELTNLPVGGDWSFDHPSAAGTTFRIVNLNDGTALMSIYGNYNPNYNHPDIPAGTGIVAGVLRSTDNGQTWGDFTPIMTKTSELPYEETALCVLSDGKLLAHIRQPEGNLKQYISKDQGRSWSGPTTLTPLDGQHPGSAFKLHSGMVMATWGNRVGPNGPAEDAYFGATGMMSYNGGASWDYEHRVALEWGLTDGNCGYANGAQAGDGSILVTYYDMLPASNNTDRWLGSKVYTARFTEEQFLAASGGLPPAPEPSNGLNIEITFISIALGLLAVVGLFVIRRRKAE